MVQEQARLDNRGQGLESRARIIKIRNWLSAFNQQGFGRQGRDEGALRTSPAADASEPASRSRSRRFTVGTAEVTAEIYDPATGTWSAAAPMITARARHAAELLRDGRVLVSGGLGCRFDGGYCSTAEIYDPVFNGWSVTGSMIVPRAGHSATMLADGRVLAAGGFWAPFPPPIYRSTAEIFNPGTGTWSERAPSMAFARADHTATRLNDGTVLVAGGWDGGALHASEVYDPVERTWSGTSMFSARIGHSASLLEDGRVLAAGGGVCDPDCLGSAELYDGPPPRPARTRNAAPKSP